MPTASDILSLKPDSWLVSELGRISDANKRRLDAYVQRLGGDTEHFAFDLSQNADKRCRAAHPTHMSTLTKNCGLWYVPTLKRFMCSWVALHEHCLVVGSDTVTHADCCLLLNLLTWPSGRGGRASACAWVPSGQVGSRALAMLICNQRTEQLVSLRKLCHVTATGAFVHVRMTQAIDPSAPSQEIQWWCHVWAWS